MTPDQRKRAEGDPFNKEVYDLKLEVLTNKITEGFSSLGDKIVMVVQQSADDRKSFNKRLEDLEREVYRKKPAIDLGNGSKLYYMVLLAALLIIFILVGGKVSDIPKL